MKERETGRFPKKGKRDLIGSAILVISFRRDDSCDGRVTRRSIHRRWRAFDVER